MSPEYCQTAEPVEPIPATSHGVELTMNGINVKFDRMAIDGNPTPPPPKPSRREVAQAVARSRRSFLLAVQRRRK